MEINTYDIPNGSKIYELANRNTKTIGLKMNQLIRINIW